MPLHLLGKKSWNVYNQDNIERVRRDQERAQATDRDAERKRLSDEAADRLALLRGEASSTQNIGDTRLSRNKRKRDDIDLATNDNRPTSTSTKHSDRYDREPPATQKSDHETSDPLNNIANMRFCDAAGRGPVAQNPWYSNLSADQIPQSTVGRDVWGNQDAGRQARDQARLATSDPLLAMKRGVKQLKEVEKQKSEWRRERERDLYEVEELARRKESEQQRTRPRREHRKHHQRSRSRSRERDKPRHRTRSTSRSRSKERDRHRQRKRHRSRSPER